MGARVGQMLLQVLAEVEAGVIGADVDAHASRLFAPEPDRAQQPGLGVGAVPLSVLA